MYRRISILLAATALLLLQAATVVAIEWHFISDHDPAPRPTADLVAFATDQGPESQEAAGSEGAVTHHVGDCADCYYTCRRAPRWTVDTTYYLLWQHGRQLPALATTSPPGTLREDAGVLGEPDTTILFGNERVEEDPTSGIRVSLERTLDDCGTTAIGGGFISLEENIASFHGESDGDFILGVPFFNAETGMEASTLVGFPGENSGTLDIRDNYDVHGADVYLKKLVHCCDRYRVHLLAGYNYYQIDNELVINQFTDSAVANALITVQDTFSADNQFHGGTIGFAANACHGCWTLNFMSRVSLGSMRQRVFIDGRQRIESGGLVSTLDGGLFAQQSNSGSFSRHAFAVVPETTVTMSYCVKHWLEASVGYSVIYWSELAHAGDQIDRNVNLSQLGPNPNPPLVPVFDFKSTDNWVQGLSFSLTARF